MQPYNYQPITPDNAYGSAQNATTATNNGLLQQLAQTGQVQPTQAPQQAAAPQGNWLERLLPTAGSVLGGLGGALIPGLGETGVGEIGGAAAGSAAGQGLEDLLTGKKASLGDIGTAAAEGGIGGAVGKGVGAALGSGGEALSGLAGKGVQAASDAAANAPWQGIAGKTIANDLEPTLTSMAGYGLDTTPEALTTATSKITGGDGAVLSDLVRGAMEKSTSPVDLTDTVNLASRALTSPELAADGPTVGKAFMNTVNNVLGLKEGGLKSAYTAPDVYLARQTLMNKAYAPGVSDALSQSYRDVANSLDDALTKSGVDSAVAEQGITPEQFQTLHDISPQLANEATQASQQGVGALRALQKPFVNASNLARAAITSNGRQLPGAVAAKTEQAIAKAGSGNIISPEAASAVSTLHPVGGVVSKLVNLFGNPKVTGTAGGALSSIAGSAAPGVLSQVAAHAPSLGAAPTTGTGYNGGQMNPMATQGATPGVDPQLLSLLINAGVGGQSGTQSALAPILAQEAGQVQQARVAQPILSGVENAYGNAGGGQGTGSGILSQISSLIPGTAAYQYNAQKAAAATALGKALGVDPSAVMGLLPSLLAGQQGATQNFGILQNATNTAGSPNLGAL